MLRASAEPFFDAGYDLAGRNAHGLAETKKAVHAQRRGAALDVADVGTVHLGPNGYFFLSQAGVLPCLAQNLSHHRRTGVITRHAEKSMDKQEISL